jgi:hypothetical protein
MAPPGFRHAVGQRQKKWEAYRWQEQQPTWSQRQRRVLKI